MPEFDEERFLADINYPTSEQVERAARLISAADSGEEMYDWRDHVPEARRALILQLNRAKWQIGL